MDKARIFLPYSPRFRKDIPFIGLPPQYFVWSYLDFLDNSLRRMIYFKGNDMNGFSVFSGNLGTGEGWIVYSGDLI
jgi:hypothetical protein